MSAKKSKTSDALSEDEADQAQAALVIDKINRLPQNLVHNGGIAMHSWMHPKYSSLADIPENDETIDWDRLTELEFATKMKNTFALEGNLMFTESNCYYFGVVDFKTPADVMGIVTQWRILGPKRTELYRFFDMLFNLYFGAFKREKMQGTFGETPAKANEIFKTLLKLDSPIYRTAILKNLEVLLYRTEASISWNKHSNLFVFTDRIVDLNTGLDVKPVASQYINVSCGHGGNINLLSFDGFDSVSNKQMVEAASSHIWQFLLDITSDDDESDELVHYLLKVMSSFLFQGNEEEKCYFLLGEGRNGKVCFVF